MERPFHWKLDGRRYSFNEFIEITILVIKKEYIRKIKYKL